MDGDQPSNGLVLRQQTVEGGRVKRLIGRDFQHDGVDAVGLHDLQPTPTEVAVDADRDALAGREQRVDDGVPG